MTGPLTVLSAWSLGMLWRSLSWPIRLPSPALISASALYTMLALAQLLHTQVSIPGLPRAAGSSVITSQGAMCLWILQLSFYQQCFLIHHEILVCIQIDSNLILDLWSAWCKGQAETGCFCISESWLGVVGKTGISSWVTRRRVIGRCRCCDDVGCCWLQQQQPLLVSQVPGPRLNSEHRFPILWFWRLKLR